ncbi:MAG: acyl-CoA dehydrogenase, partial [Actinomycetota bacterium]|nr:acyl-CoA dehydrogenase [Actinomycetota bacterium]
MTELADRISGTTIGAVDGGRPAVDVAALGEQLLGKWADIRRQARELAARPELHKIEGLTYTEHRKRTLGQLRYLVD